MRQSMKGMLAFAREQNLSLPQINVLIHLLVESLIETRFQWLDDFSLLINTKKANQILLSISELTEVIARSRLRSCRLSQPQHLAPDRIAHPI